MLENLIFSINTALPIFLVMLIGWGLKYKRIINDSFIQTANTLVFYVALPIKLFYDVSQSTLIEAFDIRLILFLTGAMTGGAAIAWIIGKKIVQDPAQLGAFVHGAFRGNFLYIGFSLMENITGSIGTKTPIAVAFMVPLFNILAVVILTAARTEDRRRGYVRKAATAIIRNPLILAIMAGAVVSFLPLEIPLVMTRAMSHISSLTTPLALIAIGASFVLKESIRNLKPVLFASGIKLILLPLATVWLALLAGFSGEDIILVYILFGVPTSTASYIMTAAMQGDGELAANIIMITTALSVFTMTAFVFAFKTMGII
ncbi:MAG: AEC family transporter [Bacillota bacterium]|nr:AEC family transporter [Bacillota bacterium]MDW7676338.1 AEC family transporter [Bacillota bacterium]